MTSCRAERESWPPLSRQLFNFGRRRREDLVVFVKDMRKSLIPIGPGELHLGRGEGLLMSIVSELESAMSS